MTIGSLVSMAVSALMVLVDASVRTLVFALAVAAGTVFLGRASAAMKLGVWRVVLAAGIAMPFVVPFVPAVPIEVPFWTPVVPEATHVASQTTAPLIALSSLLASASGGDARFSTLDWPSVAGVVYAAGASLLFIRIGSGLVTSRRFLRRARPIEDRPANALVGELSRRIGLNKPPAFSESSDALVPLTVSAVRPSIVLPADWRTWPPSQLEAVLTHELAHIVRRDLMTQHISLIYRAITWFSPMSWWLHRQLTDLSEQASDEAVLASGADSADYASTLVKFAAHAQQGPFRAHWHVAMASAGYRAAARRLDRVLGWNARPTSTWLRGLAMVLTLAAVPLAVLVASLEPSQSPQPAPRIEPRATPAPTRAATPSSAPSPAPKPAPSPVQALASGVAPPKSAPAEQQEFRSFKSMSDEEFLKDLVVQDPKATGYEAPKTLLQSPGRYTQAAMQNKVQGKVRLELVVLPDGTVGRSRIIGVAWTVGNQPFRSTDGSGLGVEALDAVNKWKFTPATLNGTPVTTVISTDLSFRIF